MRSHCAFHGLGSRIVHLYLARWICGATVPEVDLPIAGPLGSPAQWPIAIVSASHVELVLDLLRSA